MYLDKGLHHVCKVSLIVHISRLIIIAYCHLGVVLLLMWQKYIMHIVYSSTYSFSKLRGKSFSCHVHLNPHLNAKIVAHRCFFLKSPI